MFRRPRLGIHGAQKEGEETPLRFGELSIDPGRREVYRREREVPLTTIEFDLLATLASRPGFVLSRGQLLERVWEDGYFGSDHVVDVHIANLGKKIEEDPADPRYIQTVGGVGYRFRPP